MKINPCLDAKTAVFLVSVKTCVRNFNRAQPEVQIWVLFTKKGVPWTQVGIQVTHKN